MDNNKEIQYKYLKVKISSKNWYEVFGEIDISVRLQYFPLKDTKEIIVNQAIKKYLKDAKNGKIYDLIKDCFEKDKKYVIHDLPSEYDLKKNKLNIIYLCNH
tara:strand:- start:224 stop:529 length:306 start_codon:yes stop_codon:yes gene_type:complete